MTKRKKLVPCPVCQEEKNTRGIKSHIRLKHPDYKWDSSPQSKPGPSTDLSPAAQDTEAIDNKEGEKMPEYCPECHKKDLELLEKSHAIEKSQEELTRARADAQAVLDATRNTIPPLTDIIRHCESGECQEHAAEWAEIRGNIAAQALEHASPEQVRGLMKRHKIDEAPGSISFPSSLLTGRRGK